MGFLTGTKGKYKQLSTLGKEQMPAYNQLNASIAGPGAGGAFGTAGDYYRDLLSNDSQTYQQQAAPQLRQFNEEIIPGLSEQFAGMGSGGLSSSGFRNAAVNAGTDLSERLGAIRAQLRQQGAQGLMGLGQQGLKQFNENVYDAGKPGLIDSLGPLAGTALGAFGGPIAGALGNAAGNWLSGKFGKSSPYGQSQGLTNSGLAGPAF
jgi:hypothetical protein